jgi:hypothetical protein
VACFLIGALATLVTLGLWIASGTALPTLAYLLAMLMPVGLLLIGIDFVRTARRNLR